MFNNNFMVSYNLLIYSSYSILFYYYFPSPQLLLICFLLIFLKLIYITNIKKNFISIIILSILLLIFLF